MDKIIESQNEVFNRNTYFRMLVRSNIFNRLNRIEIWALYWLESLI